MKQMIMAALSLVLAVGALILTSLKKEVRIGYAETSVLITNFNQAILARNKYEESQKEWDRNLKMINDSLMAAMENLKQNYEASSKPRQEEIRRNLDKWNSDRSRYAAAVKEMSKEREKALMDPVLSNLNTYLKQWGEEQGYDMILGTMTGGNILQAKSIHNVTSKFLAALNDHYKDLPAATALAPVSTALPLAKTAEPKKDSLKAAATAR
jgi:outer membrane protein